MRRAILAAVAAVVLMGAVSVGPAVMSNDMPDWTVIQSKNVQVASGGWGSASGFAWQTLSTVTPALGLVYGWSMRGIGQGATIGAAIAFVEMQIIDQHAHAVFVDMIPVGVGAYSGQIVTLPAPWAPPGLVVGDTWTIQLRVADQVGVTTASVSVNLLYG